MLFMVGYVGMYPFCAAGIEEGDDDDDDDDEGVAVVE